MAILVCNQSEPTVDPTTGAVTPSLMTFNECTTPSTRQGTACAHADQRLRAVSGISCRMGAVEQPSQFMEYWSWRSHALRDGEALEDRESIPKSRLPDPRRQELPRRLGDAAPGAVRDDRPGAARRLVRGTPGAALDVYRETAKRTAVKPPLAEDRFLNAFAHIFAGGYAAGYFSYKWAEVLSADGFAAFEEGGLDKDWVVEGLGRLYADTVLGMGGSKPAAEVFELFRGRAPQATALLRHNDLV